MATSGENRRTGVQVEEYRADARGRRAEHVGTDGWFDVEDDGTPVEVKSTERRVENPSESRPGRYQIERSNHRNLRDHSGEYDFVLRGADDEPQVLAEDTLTADELDELLDENDRTWPSGNTKLKVSWREIHDVDEVESRR